MSSGSRSPRSSCEVDLGAANLARLCERDRLRAEPLCGQDAAAARRRRVDPDTLQVAAELLDRLDRPHALDLDRDPAALRVAAHEVDGADVGRPLAANEPNPFAERLRPLPRAPPGGRARRRPSRARRPRPSRARRRSRPRTRGSRAGPPSCPPACARRAVRADLLPPRSLSAESSSSAACTRRRPRGRAPSRRISASASRVDSGRKAVEPARVANLAAGDDEAHRGGPYCPLRTHLPSGACIR